MFTLLNIKSMFEDEEEVAVTFYPFSCVISKDLYISEEYSCNVVAFAASLETEYYVAVINTKGNL